MAAGTRGALLPVRHSFVTAAAIQDVAARPDQPHRGPVPRPAQVPHRSPRRSRTVILAQDSPGPGHRADFNSVGHVVSLSGQKARPGFPERAQAYPFGQVQAAAGSFRAAAAAIR